MDIETSDFLSVLRFLQYTRKHYKPIMILLFLFTVLAYYGTKGLNSYESSVIFIMNNLPAAQVTGSNNGVDADMDALKLNSLQLFYSTEVIEKVMRKIDLYACFGIKKNSHYAHEKLVKAIRSSIHMEYKKTGGYIITISTSDRNFSAAIANALMDETDALNKRLMLDEFSKKAEIMNNLIVRSHGNAGSNNPDLIQNIESIQQLTKFLELQKTKTSEQKELETRLYNVLALLQQNAEDMTRARDYYDVVLKNTVSDNFRFFYVIARAIPDYKNYFIRNASIAAGIGAAITLLIMMCVYYVRRQLSYLSVLGLHIDKRNYPVRESKRESFIKTNV